MRTRWIMAALLALFGVGVVAWCGWEGWLPFSFGRRPRTVPIEDVRLGDGYVSTTGTAHYTVRVSQTYGATWLQRRERTVQVFPLFRSLDTRGREVHVLVLSERTPDRLLDFEDRTVTGWVRRPTVRWLGRGVLDAFYAVGYEFPDDYVLLIEDPPEREP